VNRRTLLTAAAAGLIADAAGSIPIIDTHIHLFDPTRPQGVPWPAKDNKVLYQPALPDRYRKIAVPLGIVGAIEVEASPLLEDNQWVLDVAAKDKIVVGMVGDLEPGKPDFRKHLERFHRNPLYRGIRIGNLWGRNIHDDLPKAEFIADLKALADAGLEVDIANPTPVLINDLVRLTDKIPTLRVVIDHLLRIDLPDGRLGPHSMPAITRRFEEVVVRFDQLRPEAPLEDVPLVAVPPVIPLPVAAIQILHSL